MVEDKLNYEDVRFGDRAIEARKSGKEILEIYQTVPRMINTRSLPGECAGLTVADALTARVLQGEPFWLMGGSATAKSLMLDDYRNHLAGGQFDPDNGEKTGECYMAEVLMGTTQSELDFARQEKIQGNGFVYVPTGRHNATMFFLDEILHAIGPVQGALQGVTQGRYSQNGLDLQLGRGGYFLCGVTSNDPRAPTELMNIRVSDFSLDLKELNIREEASKTFGRRIKLMLCSELVKRYIKENDLGKDDYLFKFSPPVINRYLKRLAKKLFGDEKSLAGQNYSDLTMYDFRHCSCCYWLPRYKSESALKYRFGWKKSEKIHYYSEMIGMRDTISDEDLLVDVTKTELEKRLVKAEHKSELLESQMEDTKKQQAETKTLLNDLDKKIRFIIKHGHELFSKKRVKKCEVFN